MPWTTNFTWTSLAAKDMNFSDQSLHLFLSLSIIGWNCSSFILPSGVGSPRYLLSKVSVCTPGMFFISSLVAAGHTSLNRMEHLLSLRSWPVHFWKVTNTLLMDSACSTAALKKVSYHPRRGASRYWAISRYFDRRHVVHNHFFFQQMYQSNCDKEKQIRAVRVPLPQASGWDKRV